MNSSYVPRYWALLVLGVVLVAAGLSIIGHVQKSVVGVCLGVGSGLIAMNLVNLAVYRYYKKRPDLEKQSRIDAHDERMIAITARAKAKAFDVLIWTLIAFPFVLILADVPLWQTLATVAIYVFGYCVQLYYTGRLSREM